MPTYAVSESGLVGYSLYVKSSDGSLVPYDLPSSGEGDSQGEQPNPDYAPAKSWDYQTANFSQWDDIHAASDNQPAIVSDIVRSGFASSARMTALMGKLPSWDTQTDVDRTELYASAASTGSPVEGLEQWYWWSTYFPADIQLDSGLWLVYSQFHHSGSTGNSPVSFELSSDTIPKLRLNIRGGNPDKTLRWSKQWNFTFNRGEWIDHLIYVKWSSDPAKGRFGLWLNGVEIIPPTEAVANLYSSGGPNNGPQTNYLKQGIYRGRTERVHTIHHTGTVRGASRTSVLKYI